MRFGWRRRIAFLASTDLLVDVAKVVCEHCDDIIELQVLLAIHEVATLLDLNGVNDAILLGKFLAPDVHNFLESEFTGAEKRGVRAPVHVGICDVIDDKIVIRSADFELFDE